MPIWVKNPWIALQWREFQDSWVVFDVASGQTHALDTISAAVLMRIHDGSADLLQIAAFVQEVAGGDVVIPRTAIESHIAQFVVLGLVQSKLL